MLNESLTKYRDSASQLKVENAKLTTQLTYSEERLVAV